MRNLNMTISKYIASFFCVSVSLFLVSCASESYEKTGVVHDPLENINRTTLKINDAADKAILEPIAKGYRKATPQWSRTVVSNFLRNLNSPVVIGNQILQGDVEGTANATARVIINTLAGFGGILDLAEEGGIPHEQEDFGQTLAKWGFGDGMYVMLPLLGPSNVRDATGSLVDSYADPLRIYLFNIDEEHLHYTRIAANVVSQREQLIEVINDLRRNSFDYYAAIRSAYYQSRQSLINDGAVGNYPDFDEF
jgi:phospholipid-binding lipoprotein MlaA